MKKSYKGTFNVRIDPELHKKASITSASMGLSLNQLVEEAIRKFVEQRKARP